MHAPACVLQHRPRAGRLQLGAAALALQVFEKAMKEAAGDVPEALQRTFAQLDKRFLASSEPSMVRARCLVLQLMPSDLPPGAVTPDAAMPDDAWCSDAW